MKALAHLASIIVAALVLLGGPFVAFGDFGSLSSRISGVDTISSATTIQDAPSGHYTIYLNREKHPASEVLADWVTFFSGADDVPLIMEDIDCMVLAEDAAGMEMAKSLQSRLPANQMSITVESAPLALSKAELGMFDALVLSDEAAASFEASTVLDSVDVEVVSR